MNSTAGALAEEALAMIRGARERGIDVTTEAYPYTASASLIESPLFDGWVDRPRDAYRRLQWVGTGERLTPETFERYRSQGGWVIMHGRSEETNEWIVGQPDVIAASDGIPFSQGRSHPRGAGTFARILGHYARDRGALSLMEALRKMTLLPARRLEAIMPQMARKGRVQVGSDADLTIFDPERIIDRATYDAPDQYSAGIEHVLVAGTFVVRDRGAGRGSPARAAAARAIPGRGVESTLLGSPPGSVGSHHERRRNSGRFILRGAPASDRVSRRGVQVRPQVRRFFPVSISRWNRSSSCASAASRPLRKRPRYRRTRVASRLTSSLRPGSARHSSRSRSAWGLPTGLRS